MWQQGSEDTKQMSGCVRSISRRWSQVEVHRQEQRESKQDRCNANPTKPCSFKSNHRTKSTSQKKKKMSIMTFTQTCSCEKVYVVYHNLFRIQMGLHLAERRTPLAHMSAAWSNSSQGIWGHFTRPDGANTVLFMHNFLYTLLNQLKNHFLNS